MVLLFTVLFLSTDVNTQHHTYRCHVNLSYSYLGADKQGSTNQPFWRNAMLLR